MFLLQFLLFNFLKQECGDPGYAQIYQVKKELKYADCDFLTLGENLKYIEILSVCSYVFSVFV